MRHATNYTILTVVGFVAPLQAAIAQGGTESRDEIVARRWQAYRALDSIAVIEHNVMIPMRDGVRLATHLYRPKNVKTKVPTIFVRTPYYMNWWDMTLRAPQPVTGPSNAIKRGYAYVEQNERGHFFSEGTWDILGPPRTDGSDAFAWIAKQPWSNGKVGLIGCSSTAEWQMGVAALNSPALGAIIPQSFGAGIGRVGRFYEQGNWYRGGAFQMLFAEWIYSEQNIQRPTFAKNISQRDLERLAKSFDLASRGPRVNWDSAYWHLPVQDMIRALDGPKGAFADPTPVATGGRMIQRTPNDPAWYRGGLYHDNMQINVPGLWFITWYDISVSPNLETFNHVRKTAQGRGANNQYAIIAPTLHCRYKRATENTIVGERSVGDARYDYDALTYGWFDHFLKGENNGLLDTLPKVRYYTMGINKWQSTDTWPPTGAHPMTFYLSSAGKANSIRGDGTLTVTPPRADAPDTFTYDPKRPVPTHGGGFCCMSDTLTMPRGALDQQKLEERPDVLIYSTEPFSQGTEVSGPIEVTLYVSSDRKDTDFTVKVLDVYPDGRAYNLDETIQRVRYREGYEKPVWMVPERVYKVGLGPMNTSNYFEAGHRLRIEVSSSNFPRFDRNLNTGGRNYDEAEGLVAHNAVHHSSQYPSQVKITVVKR